MHEPVMKEEVVRYLVLRPGGVFIDATLGAGGLAAALLEAAGPGARLIGIDRDPRAVERARARLAAYAGQCEFVCGNFADIGRIARERGAAEVDGVIVDTGISSDQLDDPARGFTFAADGALDMRLSPSDPRTAADVVNRLPADELAAIFRELGDEPDARRIARAIEAERAREPIRTTGRLARIVERVKGGARGRLHPATKVFMAVRMYVNGETEALEAALPQALGLLKAGQRMGVISFERLNDRIVKRFVRAHAGRWENRAEGGRDWVCAMPPVREVTRRPATPTEAEVQRNPRSRSSRLRVAERVENPHVE